MARCYFRKGFADEVTFESQISRGGKPHSNLGRQRAQQAQMLRRGNAGSLGRGCWRGDPGAGAQ